MIEITLKKCRVTVDNFCLKRGQTRRIHYVLVQKGWQRELIAIRNKLILLFQSFQKTRSVDFVGDNQQLEEKDFFARIQKVLEVRGFGLLQSTSGPTLPTCVSNYICKYAYCYKYSWQGKRGQKGYEQRQVNVRELLVHVRDEVKSGAKKKLASPKLGECIYTRAL